MLYLRISVSKVPLSFFRFLLPKQISFFKTSSWKNSCIYIPFLPDHLQIPNKAEERVVATEEAATTSSEPSEEAKKPETTNKKNKIDENEQVSRRRSSEGSSANPVLSSQRTRRKSEDDPVCTSSPKETPESSQALNPFIEVESELEKMFAGIVETTTETKPPTDLGQDTSAKEPLAMEEKPDVSLKMETEHENSLQQSVGNLTDVSSSVDVKATPKKGL